MLNRTGKGCLLYTSISLMKAESGDFFEDSLENVCSTKFWNQNMIDSVQKYLGYDITPYLQMCIRDSL